MKSRIKWFNQGDRNTKFLQICTLKRRRKNKIHYIKKSNLSWTSNQNEIKFEILIYLKQTFSTFLNSTDTEPFNLSPSRFPSLCNSHHDNLTIPPNEIEVKKNFR